MYEKKILLGLIRAHILHHADSAEGIYGSWMMCELEGHGYSISPGTLYPILHGLKKDGAVDVEEVLVDGKIRKVYRITDKGREALKRMKGFVRELSEEVLD